MSIDRTLTGSADQSDHSHPMKDINSWNIYFLMVAQDPKRESSPPMGLAWRWPSGSHHPLRVLIAALEIRTSSAFLCPCTKDLLYLLDIHV